MTPDEYARLRRLFDEALDLPPAEQRAFVEAQTPPDSEARRELLAILAARDDSGFLATPDGPHTAPPEGDDDQALADTQIGPYKLLRRLGAGGMGVVFLAQRNDDVFHKTVAIKIIRAGAVHGEARERFRRERQILAGLDHPNIARILDGGDTADGRPFYVMEYVAGVAIDDHCERTGADVRTRVGLVAQVCDAVEYLHDHAIVHRDIKPGNILVTAEGRAKLLDLGIAGVHTAEGLVPTPGAAGTPTRMLTPGFASPEQLEGRPASKGSDIYSLGVLLYYLLAQRLPYVDAEGAPSLAKQLVEAEPPPPSAAAGVRGTTVRITPDLDRVVLTALRRDPLRRYDSVRALRDDLQRFLSGDAVAARADAWGYRTWKTVSRHKVLAAACVALLLAVGAAAWFAIGMRMEQARLAAREADFDKLLGALTTDVESWAARREPVPAEQQSAVVQRAAGLLQDETLKRAAARGERPQFVARVVEGVSHVLERAEKMSTGAVTVKKDLSLAFRNVGDFRMVVATVSGGDRAPAIRTYENAARVAGSVSQTDAEWARVFLGELQGRLAALGTPFDVTVYLQERTAPVEAAPPEPAPAAPPAVRPPMPAQAVDPVLAREVRRQIERLEAAAKDARSGAATLGAQLEARNQSLRVDTSAQLTQVEMFLAQAREELAAGQLEAARDSTRKADYVLRRVRAAIGS